MLSLYRLIQKQGRCLGKLSRRFRRQISQGDAESWLTAESYGPTQIYVNMDSQTAAEGVMFLYGANWNVVMVIICTLNI